MEIDKLLFENLRTLGINSSFEELDVDKDGKITQKDAASSQNSTISGEINMLLNAIDSDPSLEKTGNGDDDDWDDIDDVDDTDDLDDIDDIDDDDDIDDVEEDDDIDDVGDTDDADDDAEIRNIPLNNRTTENNNTFDQAKYDALMEELNALNVVIEGLEKEIETLEAENERLKEEKAELEAEQKAKQEELDRANVDLEREEEKLAEYNAEYEKVQTNMQDINHQILLEQGRREDEYNNDIKKLTNDAINAYNPETDGENFNAYFAQKMASYGMPAFTKLASLNDDVMSLSDTADDILQNISTQASVVQRAKNNATNISNALALINTNLETKTNAINVNNTKITGLQTTLNTKNAEKAEINKEIGALLPGGGLTAKEVLAQISECEKNCAKQLGWNLEDCYVAMGKEDGKFHIYPKEGGPGAVRQYYGQQGDMYGAESTTYVPLGNGFISNVETAAAGSGSAVYQFSSVNEDWTDGESCCFAGCYQTYSPLSFDINGDGVKTTQETVSYDIDGDGKKDIINNSADWVLAFDKDGNGIAGEDGSELFGNNTDLDGDGVKEGYKDGFEALKALATKEGLISATDGVLDENDIKLLQEKYGLVMTKGYNGEAKNLTDLGITEINLAKTSKTSVERNFDGKNNDIMRQEGATFVVNGEVREYADIWHTKKSSSEDAEKVKARLNPKLETFERASTYVNTKNILGTTKDGVSAMQGNVDYASIQNAALDNTDAPKDILAEIVEIEEDEES